MNSQEIHQLEIIPPSPVAYEFVKYGQVPVGLFTGTNNFSVPLYNFETSNIQIPISLNYSSNGIKVDEVSSNVGHGWSVQAGGMVSRIVRNKPDEEREALIPDDYIQEYGFFNETGMNFLFNVGEDIYDAETDLYMYNFLGYSGKFVFDNKNKGILLMPQTDLKIEIIEEGFEITSIDGVKYSFTVKEKTETKVTGAGHQPHQKSAVTSWYLSKIEHPKGEIVYFDYITQNNNYFYESNKTESIKRMSPKIQNDCQGIKIGDNYAPTETTTLMKVFPVVLDKIRTNNLQFGEVQFVSNISHPEINGYKMLSSLIVRDMKLNEVEKIDFTYYNTIKDRALLDNIQFKNPEKHFSFEYYDPDSIPERLSKSVDYYGYFNGKNNQHRYPDPSDPFIEAYIPEVLKNIPGGADKSVVPEKAKIGMLKRVIYPTKGITEFEYETDVKDVQYVVYPPDVNLGLSVLSDAAPGTRKVLDSISTQEIKFNQIGTIYYYHGINHYCPPGQPTHHKSKLTIKDNLGSAVPIYRIGPNGEIINITENVVFLGEESQQNPRDNHLQFDLIAERVYTFILETLFYCQDASISFTYKPGELTTRTKEIPMGNVRVKKTQFYASQNSAEPEKIIRYYYGKKESPNVSSAVYGAKPFYVTKSGVRDFCEPTGGPPGVYYDINYVALNSNSLRQLFNSSDVSSATYRYVTLSYGGDNFEEGGVENEFYIMEDVPGNPIVGDPIDGSPWVNEGWKNGLLKKETVFKKKQNGGIVLLKETTNNYREETESFQQVYGYSVNRKFEPSPLSVTYVCQLEDLTKERVISYCKTEHSHSWWIPTMTCIARGANMVNSIIRHPCFGQQEGHLIIFPERLNHLDIMEYTNNSYRFYLDSSIVKEYTDDGEFIEKTTDYYYDNPIHLQLTRKKETLGNGDVFTTHFEYPDDVSHKPYMSNLINQYRIGEPVRRQLFLDSGNGNELIETEETTFGKFGDLYLPRFLKKAKGNELLENRLVFSDYDNSGNLIEVYKPGGGYVLYIMGYNKTKPVAMIEMV